VLPRGSDLRGFEGLAADRHGATPSVIVLRVCQKQDTPGVPGASEPASESAPDRDIPAVTGRGAVFPVGKRTDEVPKKTAIGAAVGIHEYQYLRTLSDLAKRAKLVVDLLAALKRHTCMHQLRRHLRIALNESVYRRAGFVVCRGRGEDDLEIRVILVEDRLDVLFEAGIKSPAWEDDTDLWCVTGWRSGQLAQHITPKSQRKQHRQRAQRDGCRGENYG